MPDPKQSFLLLFQATAILAVVAGVLAFVIYRQAGKGSLLPRSSAWNVQWSGWAVLVAFIAMIALPSLLQLILDGSGFYHVLYGPDFPTGADPNKLEEKQASHLRALWSRTLAAPLIVFLLMMGIHQVFNATSEQMGVSRKRLGSNIALGYVGWLIIAPLSFVLFAAAIVLLTPNPDKHPLMDLGPRAGEVEFVIFALQAAICWPIVEELVFRGLLLAWLIQEPKSGTSSDVILQPRHRGHVCIAVGMLLSVQTPALTEAVKVQRWDQVLANLGPFLFIAVLLPFYLFLPVSKWTRRRTGMASPQTNQALFASAIFFAAVHSSVWPTPIPLLLLGLGLGWLAIRTRSIVPSIVVHALFNGVAVIYQGFGS